MSHLSSVFTKTKVDVPNRSGFDLSHETLGTLKVGTLTPVLCEELLPNDTVSLGCLSQITLPPMATDFYGRVDLRLEAFFVPNRILWGGWERFMTLPVSNPFTSNTNLYRDSALPTARIYMTVTSDAEDLFNTYFGAGSLADYLGYKLTYDTALSSSTDNYLYLPNILPFMAYHKIYEDWYRDSLIQTPLFGRSASASNSVVFELPYATNVSSSNGSAELLSQNLSSLDNGVGTSSYPLNFLDGVNLLALRQRNWAKDYFTTAHYYPQSNDSASGISVDTSDSSFTIPDLRAANVIQRWIERNNIAGTRYSDQIKATFGIQPSDATLDRAIFLGSTKFGVYNKSVYNTSGMSDAADTSVNPFDSVGSSGAASKGMGDSSLVDSFTASEHGHLMVIASLVPHQYYGSGTRRYLMRHTPYDFANPLLQGLGEQAIYDWEMNSFYSNLPTYAAGTTELTVTPLEGSISDNDAFSTSSYIQAQENVWGYTQQYAEYKYHDDEVHGLLRDGENLQYFALQSSYEETELGSDFLQIPTDYMDNVTAVSASLSKYGAWYDFYFKFKKISTLSEYVIPTLGDLKNTHKETIDYNGKRL